MDPGSGMEKIRIRDPGWKKVGSGIRDEKMLDPGSGINIPDPQHWSPDSFLILRILTKNPRNKKAQIFS